MREERTQRENATLREEIDHASAFEASAGTSPSAVLKLTELTKFPKLTMQVTYPVQLPLCFQ